MMPEVTGVAELLVEFKEMLDRWVTVVESGCGWGWSLEGLNGGPSGFSGRPGAIVIRRNSN